MEVSVCTRFPDDELGVKYVELDELAGESDFISLHSMLDKHTTGMIGARLLSLMKPTTFLINTARAALVDEDALYSALSEERIAGAAFDGFWQEPAPANHRFLQLRNFLITPHVAWAARETRQGMIESMARVIRSFQSGRAINVVS